MNIFKKYKKWEREVYRKKPWNIGFMDYDETALDKPFEISWLDACGYDVNWFADPFILSAAGNKIEVLVEEMMLDRPKKAFSVRGTTTVRNWARISKLEIERKGGKYLLRKVVPLIEDETHYSFPAIYHHDGKIFIHPENHESNTSPLFEYNPATRTTTRAGTLCDAPLTDAVLFDGFGEWLLFATREGDDPVGVPVKGMGAANGNKLGVYRSTTGKWNGPYEPRPFEEIEFPDASARGAGHFLKLKDGRIVRVAQACNRRYGEAVVFYEMKRENGKFSFKEIARHYPKSPIWHASLHTFNTLGNLAVTDGCGYTHPLKRALYRAKEKLRGIFRRK